ncbi:hypothetical protein BKA61DRAFT_634632 [Leptodontidium sp. MPI-SDFR-AT-0119]|nr:hypothetical protein BKA61DRAFT_634632 [Leptodontidium sp. MPI-SDFR-AT-0119]
MDRRQYVVHGKGQGLVILLHGVPGTSGVTTASEVQKILESYLELARKWGCVLLLDEADVFLAERTKGDILQNSLVSGNSVFLRVLEYYKGILILTTSRVGGFDEAVKSRIHIALYFAKLDRKSTMKIWENNIKIRSNTKRPIALSRRDIRTFAQDQWQKADEQPQISRWNGRQIKNAF